MAAEDSKLAEILAKELDGEALTRAEFIQLAAYWTKNLMINQYSFIELSAEESAGNLLYLKGSFDQFPTLRWAWENRQEFFNSEFVEYVNENLIDE